MNIIKANIRTHSQGKTLFATFSSLISLVNMLTLANEHLTDSITEANETVISLANI